MAAHALVLSSLTMMALLTLLFGQLDFLAPYRTLIVHSYFDVVLLYFVALGVNLFAGFYYLSRVLFLKDTGSKLAHLSRQLRSDGSPSEDASKRFGGRDGPRSDVPNIEPLVSDRTPDVQERATERDLANNSGLEQEPSLFVTRGHSYRLNRSQLDSMNDIGRFRTVAVEDLDRYRYGSAKDVAERELGELARQGLLQIKSVRTLGPQAFIRVAVLTPVGRETLATHGPRQARQALYAGLVKAREVPHDAAIYRMFQAERARIGRAGGQVQRVVLDYELKRNVYTPLAKFRSKNPNASPQAYALRQREVAEQFGLKVIDSRIPLPDLRIEYIDSGGNQARVDLELATHHYHGDAMRTKAEAGFTFYADAGSVQRLSKVLEERDITVAILSL